MKIGIFDSGIGGLTVLKELNRKYPNNQYYYFGDNANMPYGNKSKEQLEILVDRIINFLLSKNVDIIIIACGTVSSTLYHELTIKYTLPIYDCITPTINYINKSKYNKIGLIATTTTINSKVFEKQICKPIVSQECPLFVPLIESGNINSEEMDKAIKKYLQSFKDIDALILGCTHYPLLTEKIKTILPKAKLINMGTVLTNSLKLENKKSEVRLYFSKVDHTLIENIEQIIDNNYQLEEVKNA